MKRSQCYLASIGFTTHVSVLGSKSTTLARTAERESQSKTRGNQAANQVNNQARGLKQAAQDRCQAHLTSLEVAHLKIRTWCQPMLKAHHPTTQIQTLATEALAIGSAVVCLVLSNDRSLDLLATKLTRFTSFRQRSIASKSRANPTSQTQSLTLRRVRDELS